MVHLMEEDQLEQLEVEVLEEVLCNFLQHKDCLVAILVEADRMAHRKILFEHEQIWLGHQPKMLSTCRRK